MCGIVGYIGQSDAFPVLIEGLKRLEYRGYDSAGVALIGNQDNLNVYKTKGKVSNLEALAADKDCSGHIGIAHTRWATHGEPSAANAHPHVSMSGELALVHNGIIENYQVLKEQLADKGYTFKSSTDTEVLVQLIDHYYQQNGKDLVSAVCQALNDAIGAYAITVMEKKDPGHIVAARQSSPLVVGVGKDNKDFYIASDATPIVEHTNKVVYLEDGEIADIRVGEELNIINLEHASCSYTIKTVDLDISKLSKGGFDHYMLKEIYDQPNCLKDCMSGRLIVDKEHPENNHIVLSALRDYRDRLVNAKHIIIVACGTSWHAGLIGKQLIEKMCRKRVEVAYASEFRYMDPVIEPEDVVIAISQSGETADTLAALRLCKERGVRTIGIVNVVGSSIAREADATMYTWAGPEISVATTKAYSTQLAACYLLATEFARVRGTLADGQYEHLVTELEALPEKIEKTLADKERIQWFASKYANAKDAFFIGRGLDYAVALEGSLKFKEISYIHSEAFAAGEMKHGPISLVENGTLVVGILTQPDLFEKCVSNMVEVKSRGAFLMGLTTYGNYSIEDTAGFTVYVPKTDPHFATSLSVIPLQLLAYYVSCAKGLDVDKPRNLAKSVTVE